MALKQWTGSSTRLSPDRTSSSLGGSPMRGKGGRQCPLNQLHGPPPPTFACRQHSHPTLSPHSRLFLPVAGMALAPSQPRSRGVVVHVGDVYSVQEPASILACVVVTNPNFDQRSQVHGSQGEGVCLERVRLALRGVTPSPPCHQFHPPRTWGNLRLL